LKIHAIFDLDSIGMTVEEFQSTILSKAKYWQEEQEPPKYEYKQCNMFAGWEYVGNVKRYSTTQGPNYPGVYALVYDPDDTVTNPMLSDKLITLGESSRPAHHRIVSHTGALRGTTTNMSGKYQDHLHRINEVIGVDLKQNLSKIKIFYRPHRYDKEFEYWEDNTHHSSSMEKDAHAQYYALWNRFCPGLTRDKPSHYRIAEHKEFLINEGILIQK